ncbi:MAG: hypothetical protein AB1726_05555 [Planctomycetota bacterium]
MATSVPAGPPTAAPLPAPPRALPPADLALRAESLVDHELLDELPVFELFFKTCGFKRVHGRVWGLLVLSNRPLSSKEISAQLGISQAATSTTLHELAEWGAITSTFESARRCHLHAPVGNTLSIVATVFRRRERIVFQQFRQMAERSLRYVTQRHGERDPRVLTLRSIITTCDIGEAIMQLVFTAVQNAMSDPESLLSRAINAAFKVGVGIPARLLFGSHVGEGVAAALGDASAADGEREEEHADEDEAGHG